MLEEDLFQSRTNFCYVGKIQKKLCKAFCCRSNQPHKLHSVFAWCTLRFSKWPHSFFCSCLSRMVVYLHNLFLLNTHLARLLLTPRWVSRTKRQKDMKQLSINKSKLAVRVNHSISRRTFSRGSNLFSFLCTLIWSVMN